MQEFFLNQKFITNSNGDTLESRLNDSLSNTQYFDILAGYFRLSGFKKIFHHLQTVEKIRILVGMNLDKQSYQYINLARQNQFNYQNKTDITDAYKQNLQEQVLKDENEQDLEISALKFIEFIKNKKLEIRVYAKGNLHAKVYISRYNQQVAKIIKGSVITGSSNFSENGLNAQQEFNVELRDDADLAFASQQFENLWQDAIEVSSDFVETITTKTWLNNSITPYEIYLKFLYEYFKEDFENHDSELDDYPEKFKKLQYQQDAVNSAFRIINNYGGVFLSDVVGLGKTYMGAMLCKRLLENNHKKVIVIAPPHLIDKNNAGGWQNAFDDFHFKSRHFKCYSLGLLDDVIKNEKTENYDIVLIDESHRFRSEKTGNYPKLATICRGKKVILISATPYNNKPNDLLAQISLFQSKNDSNIPHCQNLEDFFKSLEKKLKPLDRQEDVEEFIKTSQANAKEIRSKVLKYLMVRRTRAEILKRYSEDLQAQNITFPKVNNPQPIYYQFNEAEDAIFHQTLIAITDKLTFIRYIPLSQHKNPPNGKQKTQQNNMKGFMKTLLLKRLESSIEAFKNTIARFIVSYKGFINTYENGKVFVSNKYSQKIFEFFENGEYEKIEELINDGDADEYPASDFNNDLLTLLQADLKILKQISDDWQSIKRDPKLIAFKNTLKNEQPFKYGKSIIFTESQETAKYLENNLQAHFNQRIISFAGFDDSAKREKILENFDDNSPNPKDDYDILITTDVLAEGVNLHKANVVVNYDLPWNPAKMMQRVGRINRINTKFKQIFIYNFFPTKQSNDAIKLEESAKSKIASFNSLLGNDNKLLTTDEEIKSHKLDGSMAYSQFTENQYNEEENDSIKEDEYRQIIKNIAKENPQLFAKIIKLPKKSRSARVSFENESHLVSFIKKGQAQKFYLADEYKNKVPTELDFLQAAQYLEAEQNEPISKFNDKFHSFLKANKGFFEKETQENLQKPSKKSNNQPEVKLLNYINFLSKNTQNFSDEQNDFITKLTNALSQKLIPAKTCSKIVKESKNLLSNPFKFLAFLQKNIETSLLNRHQSQHKDFNQHQIEVILSCFFNKNEHYKL
jgi:superfamily II DNA or RNA helicase